MARLLLVDDEPQLLFALERYLRRIGHEVRTAESGADGLAAILDGPPDLVVSDILMEDMDGFEFQKRVWALTGGTLPFIFLTAKSDLRDRVQGLRNGADDYIIKPFEPEELVARIEAVLSRVSVLQRQAHDGLQAARAQSLALAARRLHEPVAEIVAQLGALTAGSMGLDERSSAEALDEVRRRAGDLQTAVYDLSLASDVGDSPEGVALPLNRAPARLAPILRGAGGHASRLAHARGVTVQVVCGGLLAGTIDAEALERALGGLVERLVTLTPEGGTVRLEAHRADEGGLEIVLTDGGTGPGPAGVEPPTPVSRPEGATMRPEEPARSLVEGEGTLISLDLLRGVVRRHGGRIASTLADHDRWCVSIWLPDRQRGRRMSRPPGGRR